MDTFDKDAGYGLLDCVDLKGIRMSSSGRTMIMGCS